MPKSNFGQHYKKFSWNYKNFLFRKFMLHKFSKYFLSKSNFCEMGIAKKGNDRHIRLIPAKIWQN